MKTCLEHVLWLTAAVSAAVTAFSAYLAHRFLQQTEPSWALMLLPFLGGAATFFFAIVLLVKEKRRHLTDGAIRIFFRNFQSKMV